MKIVLPGEKPVSWNKMYSGLHWMKRRELVDAARLVVRAALAGDETPYTVPVRITVNAHFKSHPLDADNVCSKIYIDALKGWLLADDDLKCVASVTTASFIDKQNPRVEIEVIEL